MKKEIVIITTIVVIMMLILSILATNPIMICKEDLSEQYLDAIQSQSGGVYSRSLPLIPIFVSTDEIIGRTVYYTIYYFSFGSVGMSYTEGEGYNIEKPLTGA